MTSELQKLGHCIQAHAIAIGDLRIASVAATELGKLGSYEAAKAVEFEPVPDWASEDYTSKEMWE
jgi:hypothetical protein